MRNARVVQLNAKTRHVVLIKKNHKAHNILHIMRNAQLSLMNAKTRGDVLIITTHSLY
jgi:hypothetical protein